MTTIEQLEERIRVLRRGIEAHARVAKDLALRDPQMATYEAVEDLSDIACGLADMLHDDDLAASLAKVPA